MNDFAFEIRQLDFAYGPKVIFKNFDFSLESRKITALLAPSGTGKTTLLNLIAHQEKKISYVFQEPRLLDFCTVRQNVCLPLENCMSKNQAAARTDRILALTGLESLKNQKAGKLSGGQMQRVSLARAFAFPSDILLLDEAFKSLDPSAKIRLFQTLENLWATEQKSILFTTHDPMEAFCLADRILLLQGSPASIKKDYANTINRNSPITERFSMVSEEQKDLMRTFYEIS